MSLNLHTARQVTALPVLAISQMLANMVKSPSAQHQVQCGKRTSSWKRSRRRRCLSCSSSDALSSCPAIADLQGLPCASSAYHDNELILSKERVR